MGATIGDLLIECSEMLADRANSRTKDSNVGIAHRTDDLLKTSQVLMETASALERGKISSDVCYQLEQSLKFVRSVTSWKAALDSRLAALCDRLNDALISPQSISYALTRNTKLIAIPARRFFYLIGDEMIKREAETVSTAQLEDEVRKIRSAASVFIAAAEVLGAGQE